jgi:beta-glucanase (GH16 family)
VEFSGSGLPDGCEKYTGRYTGGKSGWSGTDVEVKKGLLILSLEKRRTSGQPYSSGGVGCWGWAQKYGRYEIKAKVPAGKGIDSYITLTPTKGGDGAWTGLELLAPGPDTAYVTNGYGTKAESARVTGSYAGAFRTYVIEWAPKHLRMTVDGKEIFYSRRAYSKSRWFGLVVSNGDQLTGVPDADTKLPAAFQIDRVKISAYTGVPPTARAENLTPRVAGTPTTVPTTVPPTTDTKAPAATPTDVSALPASAEQGPALAGGIWPWLLGGSLIAAGAAATLNHPRLRRPGK